MSSEADYITTIAAIGIVIMTVVLGSLQYYQGKNELIAETIESGANPVAVACAFGEFSSINEDILCQK